MDDFIVDASYKKQLKLQLDEAQTALVAAMKGLVDVTPEELHQLEDNYGYAEEAYHDYCVKEKEALKNKNLYYKGHHLTHCDNIQYHKDEESLAEYVQIIPEDRGALFE